MPSIGLSDIALDALIYYVDEDYVVMRNPTNGNCPTIIKRNPGNPDKERVLSILTRLCMLEDDEPSYRSDGLWSCKLKANGEDDAE